MTSKKNRARVAKTDKRKIRKKPSALTIESIEYVDYKDVALLQRFMSDRSKIRGREVNGNSVQQQRELANAVKNAREMALLPYAKRVASVRAGRGERGERGERSERRGDDQLNETTAPAPEIVSEIEDINIEGVTVETADESAEV